MSSEYIDSLKPKYLTIRTTKRMGHIEIEELKHQS